MNKMTWRNFEKDSVSQRGQLFLGLTLAGNAVFSRGILSGKAVLA